MTALPVSRFLDWFVVTAIGIILGVLIGQWWLTRSV